MNRSDNKYPILLNIQKPIQLKLYIKYMVSLRCKMVVKEELKTLGLNYSSINLGQVDLMETIKPQEREQFRTALLKSGLELMDDKKSVIIENIKDRSEEH